MNPNKSEIKMGVLHDVGVRMDDKLEDAERRLYAHGGAKRALRLIAKSIEGLAELVSKDVDSEDIPTEPLKVAEYCNMMISRACQMAINAAQHQENLEITAQGAVQTYEEVVSMIKKDVDQEAAKLQAFMDAIRSGEIQVEDDGTASSPNGRSRPTGVRPGASIAAQRKAEEVTKAADGDHDESKGDEDRVASEEASDAEEPKASSKKSTAKDKPKRAKRRRRKTAKSEEDDA